MMLDLMGYIADFFAGGFLCNSLPHLLCGLKGEPFPSPFAKPSGVGDSSPLVNFFWGAFNLFLGLLLLSRNPAPLGLSLNFASLVVGFMVIGTHLSWHFGRVRQSKLRK